MLANVRRIELRVIRQLRHDLLRPHQEPWEIVFEGDDAHDTLHVGAFNEDVLVGIASVMRESPPGDEDPNAWRLRGMATVPAVRGQGYGGALLERCLRHAIDRGGDLAWCTARVPAAGFYRRYAFESVGEVFDVPSIGPHILMARRLG